MSEILLEFTNIMCQLNDMFQNDKQYFALEDLLTKPGLASFFINVFTNSRQCLQYYEKDFNCMKALLPNQDWLEFVSSKYAELLLQN
jgi:hypothetical protein